MKRRDFIVGAASAATCPFAARAQRPTLPVVGLLSSASADLFAGRVRAFVEGLSKTGYVDGRNVEIEYRWADGENERLPELAADLVRRRVKVIAAISGTPAALAAKAATTTIPIVFYVGGDPVELGLVASLSRPGGNLTGFTALTVEVGAKRLELLHQVVPTARIIALLVNPTNPIADTLSRDLQEAARTLGLKLHVVHASGEQDLEFVFATIADLGAGALVIGIDPFFNARSKQLAALALRHAVPAIFQYPDFVAAGGLISYGTSFTDPLQQVGVYAGRILRGEKPLDLPVQRATKVDLSINLKTAKALGLTVPETLLATADEVIQ